MTDFKRFEVTHNGVTYISEFDFEALKQADDMKVMDCQGSPLTMSFIIFYCSVLKNHPYANQRLVREFFDGIVQDPEYGLGAFSEILEEFTTHFLALTGKRDKKKRKKFSATTVPKVANFPQAEE